MPGLLKMPWREVLPLWTLVVLLQLVLVPSQLAGCLLNPCLEVIPNKTFRCMGLNISGVPAEVPNTTQNLDLSFSNLKSLGSNYFSSVPELQLLDLTRCHIHTIEDNSFKDLHKLSTLILTANSLQYLGTAAFYGLTYLKKLVLVETNIASLTDLPIGHLHTLQELNLGHNNIASLKLPKYFTNLTSLRHLSFHSNKITYISKGDLDALREANRLNLTLVLSLNDIKYIEPGSFAKIHLGELVLRSCFENFNVMHTSLQGLTGLQVNRLIVGEFSDSQRLVAFQRGLLSGLCQVQMQEFVLICFRKIEENTDTLFNCIGNVSSIRLVDVQLEEVSEVPMFSQVKQLECKKCKFKEVPAMKLSLFKELRVVRITKTKHLNTFRQKFESLRNLEVVDLSENHLSFTRCCFLQFHKCPNLKYLNLSFNSDISMVGDLTNLKNLLYLDLQHTKLVGPGSYPVFLSLQKLVYLDISHTRTHVKSECTFCGLNSLQVLKMAGNSFEHNKLADNFQNLSRLHTLDISSCKLVQVDRSTFDALSELKNLNISNNKLLSFDPVVYKPLRALTALDFSNNQVSVLLDSALEILPDSLVLLDISQNLFECSCVHLNFLKWIKEKQELLQNKDLMICHTPAYMKNMSLLSFDLSSCHLNASTVAFSVIMLLAAVVFLFLIYKYYFQLYYSLVLLSGCKHSAERGDTYDAFVIHSSKDQDWVMKELVEPLEGGTPPFQLCLYYRDFLPGVPIVTNIIEEGFLSSRNVIAVISTDFLESKWCSFEFDIAQSWQLIEGKAGIIMIVLEEVNKTLLRQRLGLSRYLRRNTYLEWKNKEINRHIFWRQLTGVLLEGKKWNHEEVKLM
uniref:Toll-like receptor 4 n=1 Tax=Pygoscelis papua TaxID=30457 RepID=A0A6G8K4K1_PYGPA|nr:toll-like receptor 4 [Pygoscelis papua]QIM74409.1 toll-like receptor 4 [Pygoscelis papua]QIM74410.1 toll-like receptor 4 [Pygoscelis papua]QIM74411.1 toll-like receptor 4 [Pygoscelis papua]QIM74412.1 toll-like receptor 4 [Pygoscelis papua]